ncbi:MAG: CocE/NonD family hydrolase [Gemmatimonadales bacterium]|nr:CocE/NonD family hydrolase [Gemmatimonadales bacterium]
MPSRVRVALLLVLAAASAAPLRAQAPAPEAAARFTVQEVMIPARDGARLHTRIFVPKDATGPLPFLMLRTPYGIMRAERYFTSYMKALADDGYIFVFQDIRGKFGSEGTFMMQRPARARGDTLSLDEGTDTWDTIEWLLRNVPGHNGRVGMLGVSYDGWTTIMAAVEPHPALRAISPQASPADMWIGDDFHHNGAFRLSYGFEYAVSLESTKEVKPFVFDRFDTYDWYLRLGSLANANARHLKGAIPTWNDFVAHPDWDAFWQRQTVLPHLRRVQVPTLNVAGWWDQEDFWGPIAIYQQLERHDTAGINYLVVGPWNHGGWANGEGARLGPIPFDSATATHFRERVQAPWFAYWLKDRGTLDLPEALTFEAGSNRWRRWNAWPAKEGVEARMLYFGPGGTLSFTKPSATRAADRFTSDPAHPVPYRQQPIEPTYGPHARRWPTWLVEDQRFVTGRPDVLTYETEPLAEDVTIAGEVVAQLFTETTGTDADWVMKLIDAYPEQHPENWALAGYRLMVSNEVFRARYREGRERPVPLVPNRVTPLRWSLHTQDYTFRKGHRIVVQVQSSWFPLIDRNPQRFVPNIFAARDADFTAQRHTVHRSARWASGVGVSVVR